MADKKILEIPVDTAAWDSFVSSFMEYQKLLEKQESAWANSNRGIRQQRTAFDDVERSFGTVVKEVLDPKLTGSSGAFVKITKNSKETEKSWHNISRDLEKSARSMGGLARSGLNFGMLGVFGAAGSLVGGLAAGVAGANNSLASQNILNRKLGLKPGEEKAFSTVFEKAGGDTALLGRIATAKANPADWRYLMAAGISAQEIQNRDPAELAEQFMQNAARKSHEMNPASFGMWAQATGVTNLADLQSLHAMGSYNDADYAGMHDQFQKLTPQLAAQQKDLDAASAAKQQIDAALAKDALALDLAFVKLSPLVLDAANGMTKWITDFSESGELADDLHDLTTAVKGTYEAFEEGRDALNKLFGLDDKNPKSDGPSVEKGGPADKALAAMFGPNYRNNTQQWNQGEKAIPGGESMLAYYKRMIFGGGADNGQGSSPSMDRLLDATRMVESGGGKHLVGPVTKEGWQALGPYQFSPANLQHYGVADPMNEQQEREGARRKYADLRKKYGGNLHEMESAYGWGEGKVDAFLKKYQGQFKEADLPADVQEYLRKMDAAMSAGHATPFDDPKAIRSAKATDRLNNPQIVPYTDDDAKAKSGSTVASETLTQRLTRAAEMLRDTLSAGGGSAFRGDGRTSQRIDRQGNQPMTPYQINVVVTSPAGSSTTVTAGGIAQ